MKSDLALLKTLELGKLLIGEKSLASVENENEDAGQRFQREKRSQTFALAAVVSLMRNK